MQPAASPIRRPSEARLLVLGADGRLHHTRTAHLVDHLEPGDLLVANDAATIPASLAGVHRRTGGPIEIRLAGRGSLAFDDVHRFTAVAFGAGDHRTPTEHRPPPPTLCAGDALQLGPLEARVLRVLDHPRLIELDFRGSPDSVWAGIARHGRPIQYAHVAERVALWDVWTRVAARPVAFEAPSAGFGLDWALLGGLRARGIGFATLTHAAGISSTGDLALDARLPFDEPYHVPGSTAEAVARTRAGGGRVVAVGTTVTRALEHAASRPGGVRTGSGLATQRLGPDVQLRVVDAILTGAHEPGTSHYELLGAFVSAERLGRMAEALERNGYRSHEFGDLVLVWQSRAAPGVDFGPSEPTISIPEPVGAGSETRTCRVSFC